MYEHEMLEIAQNELPFKIIRHINKSGVTRSHWHHSFEISYTVKGKINQFIINEKSYTTKEGDILLINSNEIHSAKVTSLYKEENEALTILLPYSFMDKEIPEYRKRFFYIPEIEEFTNEQRRKYALLQHHLKKIFIMTESADKIDLMQIKSMLYEIIYILTKYFSVIQNEDNEEKILEFEWIDSVLVYIYEHLFESIPVTKLSKVFHLNDSYFSRKFKKYMGISVKKYVTEMRIIEALHLIVQTDLPVQVIADTCGFGSQKSLVNSFKKKYQMTPNAYRKSMRTKKIQKNV